MFTPHIKKQLFPRASLFKQHSDGHLSNFEVYGGHSKSRGMGEATFWGVVDTRVSETVCALYLLQV